MARTSEGVTPSMMYRRKDLRLNDKELTTLIDESLDIAIAERTLTDEGGTIHIYDGLFPRHPARNLNFAKGYLAAKGYEVTATRKERMPNRVYYPNAFYNRSGKITVFDVKPAE